MTRTTTGGERGAGEGGRTVARQRQADFRDSGPADHLDDRSGTWYLVHRKNRMFVWI